MDDAITRGAASFTLFVARDGVSGAYTVADVAGESFAATLHKQQSPVKGLCCFEGPFEACFRDFAPAVLLQ